MAIVKKQKQELSAEELFEAELDGLEEMFSAETENEPAQPADNPVYENPAENPVTENAPQEEKPQNEKKEDENSVSQNDGADTGRKDSVAEEDSVHGSHRLHGRITKKYTGQFVEKILASMVDGKMVEEAIENVSPEAEAVSYQLIRKKDGTVYDIGESETVGADKDFATIVIDDNKTVSRRHAKLEVEDGFLLITDLGSRNGTRVNGFDLDPNEAYELRIGNEIEFSDEEFVVSGA